VIGVRGTFGYRHFKYGIDSSRGDDLSQPELARRAGLRPETINRLKKGKHSPDTATLAKITRALRAAGVKV